MRRIVCLILCGFVTELLISDLCLAPYSCLLRFFFLSFLARLSGVLSLDMGALIECCGSVGNLTF